MTKVSLRSGDAKPGARTHGGDGRLIFVQWLRVFLITLVVAHHAASPYGPTGGAWPVDDPASSDWLLPFFAINAAFFMGFFFLIAGYFVAGSYDRKGAALYVRDRLVRLGVPLAFVSLFVFGLMAYAGADTDKGFLGFLVVDYIGHWQVEMGHLWFIAQLLVLCLLYALWRGLLGIYRRSDDRVFPVPGDRTILVYVLALGVVSALVRLAFPQDAWVRILWLIPAEPAHLPQYVSLFVIGVIAGRGAWFVKLKGEVGRRWFLFGVAAFLVEVVVRLTGVLPGFLDDPVWGFLEAFVCVGLILGLLVLFRRHCSRAGRWLGFLDANVYGVYIVHVFIVIGLQSAILSIDLPALAKFAIVTILGVTLSFLLVGLLRTIPVVRRIV